jgi:hypothetical protein
MKYIITPTSKKPPHVIKNINEFVAFNGIKFKYLAAKPIIPINNKKYEIIY